MAKPELGSKRQCQSCSTKFFDLNRTPIVCPKCGATFTAAAATRAPARAAVADDEPEVDPAGPELVSLEEADALEGKDAAASDDIEIEDDGAADETFLEEEEEDADDVAGLIDGDIEDDEES
ncbi:MAG: TIGR02300 family protein [Beijerinckiaceae bacterium]